MEYLRNTIDAVPGFIWPIVIIALLMQFELTRKALRFVLFLFPAILIGLWGCVAYLLWRPINAIVRRLPWLNLFKSGYLNLVTKGKKESPDPVTNALLREDREAAAKSIWPQEKYPELFAVIPGDLERPPYQDGKLTGGVPITWLADRHVTKDAVEYASKIGGIAALTLLLVILGLMSSIFLELIFNDDLRRHQSIGSGLVIAKWPGEEAVYASAFLGGIQSFFGGLAYIVVEAIKLFLIFCALSISAYGVGLFVAHYAISKFMRDEAEPYELFTKDAHVRWPYRLEIRDIIQSSYRKQIEQATNYLKGSPLYEIGQATGTIGYRGDLSAPQPGQSMSLDRESLFQHTLVLGGTGEGKTSAILKPMLRQVLTQPSFGAFITDAKGVLWHDALTISDTLGRRVDCQVIGDQDDQLGFDITGNLTPSQIAAVLKSVNQQISGSSNADPFWSEMAVNVIRHALEVGKSMAMVSDRSKLQVLDQFGYSYSLWWAYQFLLNPICIELVEQAHEVHLANLEQKLRDADAKNQTEEGDEVARELIKFNRKEYQSSMSYLSGPWKQMSENTRSGILANVSQLLDGFSSESGLRTKFASGPTAHQANIEDAFNGKILLVALSTIESGITARLVNVLIKTTLYRAARKRQTEIGSKACQENPCLVMMDEVQEIVTSDPSSGLSDATFWNVARSTGLAGVFATQTLAALEQAMGEAASANFIQQSRSKVFLRSEDQKTIDYAIWCAGQFERNRVFEDGQYESLEQRYRQSGWSPLAPITSTDYSKIDKPTILIWAALELLLPHYTKMRRATKRSVYDTDLRFLPVNDPENHTAIMSTLQSAHWRAEDLERQFRTQGNDMQPALSAADVLGMGRWHAYALIQRAGMMRQDIISLNHEH